MEQTGQAPLVLVLDDDAGFAAALAQSLAREAEGRLRVGFATDPEALLERAGRDAGELLAVVSDYDLRHALSGLALLRQVRSRHPGTQRILVTGHDLSRFTGEPEFALLDAAYEKSYLLGDIARPIVDRLVGRSSARTDPG